MNMGKTRLQVFKIGGAIIDQPEQLRFFLTQIAQQKGAKILVHGGGQRATQLAEQLGIPQTLVQGRRVTDAASLEIVTMVYGGLINKQLVAQLQAEKCPALGVCGADGDLLRARKRPNLGFDFGWVGDLVRVNTALLDRWLGQGLTPVIAPLSHDGQGQLLNTNADTIAQAVAQALAPAFQVELYYFFEKNGVLADPSSDQSLLTVLDREGYHSLLTTGTISNGMLPKLENAFKALENGVKKVVIGSATQVNEVLNGLAGTQLQPT